MLVVRLDDIRNFVIEKTLPVDLINNNINWIKDADGKLRPARLLFPLKLKNDTGSTRLAARSSVILESTASTPWRVFQIGGPTLIRAVKLYETLNPNFLVWIPGINRHYLGRVLLTNPNLPQIKLRVLFDDPVAGRNAGEDFDPGDRNFIEGLKKLDRDLQLAERLRPAKKVQPVEPRQAPSQTPTKR